MKTIRSVFGFAVSFLLCVFTFPAFLQAQSANAHLSGTVTDPSGATVGGVRVAARLESDRGSNISTATSSSDGSYNLSLPSGRYRIQFSSDSFGPKEVLLSLQANESRTLPVRMELAVLSANVLVTSQTEPIPMQQSAAPSSAITRQEIDQRQSVFIADALIYSPGVTIARTGINGGTASLFLDGGNSNFTKVLVDGSAINPPGGAVDFSLLTTDNIDKIEIVRGAESAFYGTDAVSGVVQLFTHRGSTHTPAFTVFAEGGSYSSGRGGGQLSGLVGGFDYSGAASYYSTDGQGPNDNFINRTLSGNFGYTFSENNQLRLTIRNNTSDAGIPGPTVFPPPSL